MEPVQCFDSLGDLTVQVRPSRAAERVIERAAGERMVEAVAYLCLLKHTAGQRAVERVEQLTVGHPDNIAEHIEAELAPDSGCRCQDRFDRWPQPAHTRV